MRDVIAALYSNLQGQQDMPPTVAGSIYLTFFLAALLVPWFVRTQLHLKPNRTTPALACGRLTIAIMLCVWLWLLFFAWPWLNWQNPWLLGYPIPRGLGLFVVGLCTLLFGLVCLHAFAVRENGARQPWLTLLKRHEWLCLKMLGAAHQHSYQHHMRWRFVLWGQTMAERWREGRIQQWLRRQRWLWVMLAGSASLSLLLWTAQWLSPEQPLQTTLQQVLFPTDKENGRGSAGAWSLFSAFLAAPMAFVLWWLRDTNQLWLIENNRKDTNLKDFQKLSEWASGTALVEDEVTTKTSPGQTTPEVSTKAASIPPSASTHRLSRRSGSETLQISAVHQLQGYLMGEYGRQFQKPAFVLLTALWQSITSPARQALPKNITEDVMDHWHATHFPSFLDSPLAHAVAATLLTQGGRALRDHAALLPNLKLTGLPSCLPGLQRLRLNDLDLQGIELQGADLSGIQLQNTRLGDAYLQKAILSGACLHDADLTDAHLQNVITPDADLHGVLMRGTELQGAYLWCAKLQGAQFINAHFDEDTLFFAAETDAQTRVVVTQEWWPSGNRDSHVPTHALRLKLRRVNELVLPDSAYQEFEPQWDALTSKERQSIYDKAYEYSANPTLFAQDFSHLD